MNDLDARMLAVARFNKALEKCAVPGSPILDAHVERMQAIRNQTIPLSDIARGTESYEWFTGGVSATGVPVTERSAMMVSAVYACVNIIAGAHVSMPIHCYAKNGNFRTPHEHPMIPLLNKQAHPRWTAASFLEFILQSKLLLGDAYAILHGRTRANPTPDAIEPVHKSRVLDTVVNDGQLWYKIVDEERGNPKVYHQDDVLHFPGPGYDGKNGMSQLRYALRNPIGVSLSADEYSAEFFRSGLRPDIAVEIPGTATPEQKELVRETWKSRHYGLTQDRLPPLLSGGMKVHEISINAEDAQLIETRKFQVEDIARAFGVPPHMIGHTEKSSSWGTGIEQMSMGFVRYTLMPHMVKLEQELNRKLITSPADKGRNLFFKFNPGGLLRGDQKSRYESYRIGLGRAGEQPFLTIDEIRALEDLEPADLQMNEDITNEPPNEPSSPQP